MMTRKTCAWLACAAMAAVAVGAGSALWADIATPRESWTPVRMESETVQVNLGLAKVKVDATFKMYNDGNEFVCKMGYPLGVFEDALNDFAVAIDGDAVKDIKTIDPNARVEKAPGESEASYQFDGPYKQWKTWEMPIKAHQQRTVKVTYWVKPATIKDAKEGELQFYSYTLKTGATWKGKINSAEITVTLDDVKPEQLVRRSPDGYEETQKGKVTTWKMENFKPTANIEVAFRAGAKADKTALSVRDGR